MMEAAADVDLHNVNALNDVSHRESKLSSTFSSSSSAAAAAAASTGQSIGSVERVLISIHDLLEAKLRSETRRRNQIDKDQQLANEWLAAAAVIDRISFISRAVLITAGSAVFLFCFSYPNDFGRKLIGET